MESECVTAKLQFICFLTVGSVISFPHQAASRAAAVPHRKFQFTMQTTRDS